MGRPAQSLLTFLLTLSWISMEMVVVWGEMAHKFPSISGKMLSAGVIISSEIALEFLPPSIVFNATGENVSVRRVYDHPP